MDVISTAFFTVFVALLLGAALFFGFVMLLWIVAAALVAALCLFIRDSLRRWLFLRGASRSPPPKFPDVIEGEYEDITDKTRH